MKQLFLFPKIKRQNAVILSGLNLALSWITGQGVVECNSLLVSRGCR